MGMSLNKEDWQAGYDAGRRRERNQPPAGVEVLSWSSGYIEGKAAPAAPAPPDTEPDPEGPR